MKNRILSFALVFALVVSMLGTTLAFAADVGATDDAWSGFTATATVAEDGYTTIGNLGWGCRTWKAEKVQFEGLKLTMKVSKFASGEFAGFYFTSDTQNGYYGKNTPLCMTLWQAAGFAPSQSRLHFGLDHDPSQSSVVYPSVDAAATGCGVAGSMVLNNVTNATLTFEIDHYNDEFYSIKVSIDTADLMWGNNANYNADEMSSTVYLKKADIAGALDSEGKTYVVAAGSGAMGFDVKVEESAEPPVTPPVTPPATECEKHVDADLDGWCDECKAEVPVEEPAAPTIVGAVDGDWAIGAGTPAMSFAENGYTAVSNLAGWGFRAYYAHLVKFDGLELSFRSASNKGDCAGVFFSNVTNSSYFGSDSPFAITYWNELYPDQTRLNFGKDHDYNIASVVYSDPKCTTTGFGVASSMVCSQGEMMGWTIKITSYDDTVYQLKITMTDGTMWENNANYNADEKSCTVYLPKASVASILNENGECYVFAAGFPSGTNPGITMEYKIVDDNYTAYITSDAVVNAQAAADAYKAAAEAITDAASYDAAMVARAAALAALDGLRSRELAEINLMISSTDAILAANEDIVNIIKKAVSDKLDAAGEAYFAFREDNAGLTADSLAAALALLNDAKAEYAARASMLSEQVKADIDDALAGLDYDHSYATALLWVVTYERNIAAIEGSTTMVDDIKAAKAYKEAYIGSATETLIASLHDNDKAELEGRITTGDARIVTIETEVLPQLKESYIAAAEGKLTADLTVKFNIEDAKAAYNEIALFVTITEEDGELYTRYQAIYAALKAAAENYIIAEINAVDALLDSKYTTLDSFIPVRNRFKAISLSFLMEENADIAAQLTALEGKISLNVFYYMNHTGLPAVEQNATGVIIESKVEFPARLNYNEKLDLLAGATVVVEMTSAAYYNDGTSANNLCFNFLAAPDSYKSMSDGISIIIWLYATECSVQIMNNNDVALAQSSIPTPMDGSNITISVKYQEYYSFVADSTYWAYVINVNGAEIVLTEEVLTSQGYTMSNDVYFSMGSFADDKDENNFMTLVSVNDRTFADTPEVPDCTEHVDEDGNGKCDICDADMPVVEPPVCTEHVDEDGNGKCDVCDADVEVNVPAEKELTTLQKLWKVIIKIWNWIVAFVAALFKKG